MKTIAVRTASKTYDVHIGGGLLQKTGEYARQLGNRGTAALVTDSHVDPLYAPTVTASLEGAGFHVVKFVFPAGEASKNADTLVRLLNFLAEARLTRTDTVFALGGGVTGDMAGLAAALYMRGIGLVQHPTTLLAAVDSSVGGKTAVDLDAGKNLAGAFYQPDCVLLDTDTLSTLPDREFVNGMGEVIKYAVIRDASLLPLVNSLTVSRPEEMIARCIQIKRDVVGEDEKETGERQILNFGHTFGHAIETCSRYSLPHGFAVAAGMALMTRAAVQKGLCGRDCLQDLLGALTRHGLPTGTSYREEEIFACMLSDKKRAAEKITLVVPRGMGTCERRSVTLEEAREWLRLGLEEEG